MRNFLDIFKRTKEVLHNHYIVYVNGYPHSVFYDRTTRQIKPKVSQAMRNEILDRRHQWSVLMAVTYLDSLGDECIEWDVLTIDKPVLQTELFEVLNENHLHLIEECAPLNVKNWGWIAFPSETVFGDSECYQIFKRLRAFEDEPLPEGVLPSNLVVTI